MNDYVRVLVDWLNGTTVGSTSANTLIADVPRDGGDSAPSSLTWYDATRHAFVARGVWPTKDASVTYPAGAVRLVDLSYPVNRRYTAGGAREQPGTATLMIQLAVNLLDTDEGVEDLGYLTRAVVGSLQMFNQPENLSKRERNNVSLSVPTGLQVLTQPAEHEDTIVTATILASYSTREATPN